MKKEQILNQKYLHLCQQLGDAHFKLSQITDLIARLETQISTLNECYPILASIDASAPKSNIQEVPENQG